MNIQEQYFTCKKCGESKIWGEFGKACGTSKYGIRYKCKKCINADVDYSIIKKNSQKYHAQKIAAKYHSPENIGTDSILTCCLCNQKKHNDFFKKRFSTQSGDKVIGLDKRCSDCLDERKRKLGRKYYKTKGNAIHKESQRKYVEKNKDKIYARSADWNRNAAEEATDSYIIKLLKKNGFTREQIAENPELINIQRIIIQTKRLCKI